MRQIVLVAHNIRSAHNIGSLLRTADGIGTKMVYLSGYTPHAVYTGDTRLPHIANKVSAQIHKTALGAEQSVKWAYLPKPLAVMAELKKQGYTLCALEQALGATNLSDYKAEQKVVLLVGNELTGIEPVLLAKCDKILEIPMLGEKESFNVVQAAAMALYHLRFD